MTMRSHYLQRRNKVMQWLGELPDAELVCPDAGMFMMMRVSQYGLKSADFVSRLYHEHAVSVLDAEAFGSAGEGFVRLSFAPSVAQLEDGCQRICRFVASLRG